MAERPEEGSAVAAENAFRIDVVWEGGMRYSGGAPGGTTLEVDGARESAPSPVEAMVVALASCAAIDVVEILGKRRTPPEALSVSVRYERADQPPRRIVRADLLFRIRGVSDAQGVERALELSFDKYCSVSATFAPDTKLSWRYELES